MSVVYVDTSVLGRVLVGEADKPAIKKSLDSFDQVVSSRLLRVELRRLGLLRDLLDAAGELLSEVALISPDDTLLTTAETIPPATVRTLDAIHLTTAVKLAKADELDAVMTYDKQLAAGAREHGLTVLSPS
ncbi:MAG TPA: PIN domain-containing protein [Solirubrobacteraceae bacterium]|nr:PIN domain-containing protein [Solirubrobacteraceae bacterium]